MDPVFNLNRQSSFRGGNRGEIPFDRNDVNGGRTCETWPRGTVFRRIGPLSRSTRKKSTRFARVLTSSEDESRYFVNQFADNRASRGLLRGGSTILQSVSITSTNKTCCNYATRQTTEPNRGSCAAIVNLLVAEKIPSAEPAARTKRVGRARVTRDPRYNTRSFRLYPSSLPKVDASNRARERERERERERD